MAVTPSFGNLTLGNYLKIVSKGAVYNNLSEDSPLWDMIKKKKKGPAEGRELRFLLRSAYGSRAGGFVAVNGGSYPASSQATINEGTTQYKDYALTVEVERTLISKAISDFSRYGEPLAEELRSKTIALSRILSGSAYRDGTGVIGTTASHTTSSGAAGDSITVTLATGSSDRGHIGWFEFGDGYKFAVAATGDEITASPSTWTVTARDRQNDTVTFSADDTHTAIGANDLDATLIYRSQQATRPALPGGAFAGDYNVASEEWVGMEGLSQNDGRLVNGITLNGALGGTRRDAQGNPIDSQDFQQLMSNVMVNVGQGRYKYTKSMMAWETLDALIESREVDRRFNSIQDNQRGVSQLGYVHGKNTLIFEADEFCPKQRIYCLPEGDVCQFHGSDFDFVKPEGGQKFFLKPNGTGHDRTIRAYMEGEGALMSVHSAAIGVIENFTV
jgi:hypothetical protein